MSDSQAQELQMAKQYGTLTSGWIEKPEFRVDPIPADDVNITTTFNDDGTAGPTAWSINMPYSDWGWNWWPYQSTIPLTLTLTEVMALRKRAREDDELRAILEKFTPHIRVEVDFPAEDTPSEDL